MIILWGLVLGLPLLAFGGAALLCPSLARRFAAWFETSKGCAAVLTTVGWLWAAHECDVIGIDVFDAILLKDRTGGMFVWVLAAVLAYLTCIWMPKNLPVRALTGILMLIPAELFRTTRLLLPESGFAAVDLFVVTGYLGAIVGMYGMFYPWRLEKGLAAVLGNGAATRALGALLSLWGLSLVVTAFFV